MPKQAVSTILFLFFVSPHAGFAAEKLPCLAPVGGPQWIQRLEPKQQASLEVEWDEDDATFEIRGEYAGKPGEEKRYTKFKNEVTVKIDEVYQCGSDRKAKFAKISGHYWYEMEWQALEGQGNIESGEAEEKFQVVSLKEEEDRHLEHESESLTIADLGGALKKTKEEIEWEQSWEKFKAPYRKGEYESSSEMTLTYSPETDKEKKFQKRIFEMAGIEGVELKPGMKLLEKTEEEGEYAGSDDIAVLKSETSTRVWQNEKRDEHLVVSFESNSRESREYKFDKKKKHFVFSSARLLSREKLNKKDGSYSVELSRLEVWPKSLDVEPNVAYWKDVREIRESGNRRVYTISSKGLNLLPKFYDVPGGNGSVSRHTEYHPDGNIARLLVMYFPEAIGKSAPKNEVKLDLSFDGKGYVTSYLVNDGKDDIPDPLPPDAASEFLISNKLKPIRGIERVPANKPLHSREPDSVSYPKIRFR